MGTVRARYLSHRDRLATRAAKPNSDGITGVRIPSAGEANAGCRAVSDCIPQLDALSDAMKDLLVLPPRTR